MTTDISVDYNFLAFYVHYLETTNGNIHSACVLSAWTHLGAQARVCTVVLHYNIMLQLYLALAYAKLTLFYL